MAILVEKERKLLGLGCRQINKALTPLLPGKTAKQINDKRSGLRRSQDSRPGTGAVSVVTGFLVEPQSMWIGRRK